ncbi:hypothetical protein [Brevibacillus choshinensis]|uniref:Uncharacterized protein n=1 Tax=Brevibacillus choshinensis TaxID=54911 RepID=A0ABX7FI96_BRECH|nr:hypothetical protein [Brevibacillus choshinensis]QRG65469.1 hypothetical protein JNE38_17785 [Brevibacillus choshinensis]
MSLKTVELQVALPRTLEVSRIQEQQQQRTVHEQQSQIDERTLHDQQNRQRPTDIEHAEKNKLRDREQKQHKEQTETSSGTVASDNLAAGGEAKASLPVSMRDPLRGRHINITM